MVTPGPLLEQRIEQIPKEIKLLTTYVPLSLEAERQVCNSQSQKARDCFNLGPRDHIFNHTVSRFPVANHVVLESWLVDICQESHSLRSALQRRPMAHLGLCSHGAPGKLSNGNWGGD